MAPYSLGEHTWLKVTLGCALASLLLVAMGFAFGLLANFADFGWIFADLFYPGAVIYMASDGVVSGNRFTRITSALFFGTWISLVGVYAYWAGWLSVIKHTWLLLPGSVWAAAKD